VSDSLQLLKRVLAGDADAIAEFGDGDNCAIVGWRAGLAEIADEIAAKLPDGYFKILSTTTDELVVEVGSRTKEIVSASPETKQEELLLRFDRLLHPEYEMRQFRPFDGDGYSLYIAASSTWSSLERTDAKAIEDYFLSMPRLEAYWKKGYFARLFSKP
jgi:hypothetical protein